MRGLPTLSAIWATPHSPFCKPQVGGSIPLASSKSPNKANLQPGDTKGMCPLRGERARGLAPSAGAVRQVSEPNGHGWTVRFPSPQTALARSGGSLGEASPLSPPPDKHHYNSSSLLAPTASSFSQYRNVCERISPSSIHFLLHHIYPQLFRQSLSSLSPPNRNYPLSSTWNTSNLCDRAYTPLVFLLSMHTEPAADSSPNILRDHLKELTGIENAT